MTIAAPAPTELQTTDAARVAELADACAAALDAVAAEAATWAAHYRAATDALIAP